ncbi:MAG TPA: hypothetical protein VGT03_03860 [Candidatus Acidoferrales bacterium]|nr:hypothetical protein [Candidatus Acidoferrales bacterium]
MDRTRLEYAANALLSSGRVVFSLAIIGFGIETLVCAHRTIYLYPLASNPRFKVVPVLPFLPPIPLLAYLFGIILAVCGFGLLSRRALRASSLIVGRLMLAGAAGLNAPRYAAIPGSIGLRTLVFEPLAIAALAWLLPGRNAVPNLLERASRYLLALSLIVFGVDHFLALAPIAALIPHWIPWHIFWVAFFGAGFIAAALSVALNVLLRWSAACLGLMFAIWVFTLHLPTVLGLYVIPGRSNFASLWSSLLIAVALWGGSWALAHQSSSAAHLPLNTQDQSAWKI